MTIHIESSISSIPRSPHSGRSQSVVDHMEGGDMGNRSLMLNKYSVGIGDRFAHQGKAQLQAFVQALESGIEVIPVWNKSNREHTIIGSEPSSVREAADAAVTEL